MATTDIVARLQLRAEQFSSESGRAFAEMKTRARSAAGDVRETFSSAFADVQRLAQTSLQLPRTETGSLNLAPQIAQLNSAATAAEQNAMALRELSIAQSAAAATAGENSQSLRLQADASAVASLAAERHAQELRGEIGSLEAVQRELNQTASATRALTAAEEVAALGARRGGGSFTMFGQQLNDFAVQVISGQSAVIAFAQQLPQAAYAMRDFGGAAGRVGAFLTGPWGTALTIATVVLVPLISKLWEAEEAGNAAASGADAYVEALKRLQQQAGAFKFGSEEFGRVSTAALTAEARVAQLRAELARTPKTSYASQALAGGGTAMISTSSPIPGRNRQSVEQDLTIAIAARDKAVSERDALLMQKNNYDIANAPKPDKQRKKRGPSAASIAARDEFGNDTEDKIAAMRDRFLDLPPAVRQVQDALREVDDIVRDLNRRQPEGFEETIKKAEELRPIIREALNKPYQDYVDQQRESLAVGELVLAGRDAEADALQASLRLQQQMGPLSDEQLANILKMAEQHQRITEALEDQRRIVGVYTGMVGDLQASFRGFLDDLDGNTGSALKGLFSNWAADLKAVQRNLLSNAIFGGVDREVEKYVRQMTGKRTPAELLAEQAEAAGIELRNQVTDTGEALEDFVAVVRATTAQLGGVRGRGIGAAFAAGDGAAIGDAVARSLVRDAFDTVAKNIGSANGEVYDPQGILVTAQLDKLGEGAGQIVSASDVLGKTVDAVAANLRRNLGIEVPREILGALKSGLPTIMEGVSFGQLGGSVFSSITGGKDNKLASSVGGILGDVAGKALSKPIARIIGGALGKTLGGAAGPIGSIVGGILGNLVGGLFNKPQYGTAILTNSTDKVNGVGRGSSSIAAASGIAGSVQQGLIQLADQLGATVGNFDTVVGMFDGKYRVRTTKAGWDGKGALDFKGNSKNNLYDFGDDQQAAIAFAIADAVRDGAIQGLSAASSRILQSGSDLGKAVEKVIMIESIPKDLKAMLDPVGAAVDALNLKWKRTVDALKEGGASAEQMAQAQRLYDLQLQQTLNSTQAAAATLKEYRDSLMLGSNSPYSLRDQEATAISKLQPFLEQISSGQSVDQEKYRAAADAYLSVERELYGSTQAYFDALDTVQAATNRAIAAIENVAPITPPVESPFVKATAANTQAVAEMTEETNALLLRIASRLDELGLNDNGDVFVGSSRNFKATGGF